MGANALIAIHKGMIVDKSVAQPGRLFQDRRVQLLSSEGLQRQIDCRVQKSLVPESLHPAGLFHQHGMEHQNLALAEDLHLASSS